MAGTKNSPCLPMLKINPPNDFPSARYKSAYSVPIPKKTNSMLLTLKAFAPISKTVASFENSEIIACGNKTGLRS